MKYAPYSFSKIQTFFDCQKKFEFTYVNKIDIDRDYEDPSYFKRGRFLHAYIANRLNGGDGSKLRQYDVESDVKMDLVDCADQTLEHELISFTYDFETNMVESYISLDKNLCPTKVKEKSALGGYIDYYAVQDDYGMLVDWKTGKSHSDPNYSQLELYAIWTFQKFPQIQEIDLVFFYVEHNKFALKTITPDDVEDLKLELMSKIDIIENTDEFQINETKQCLKCPFFNTCMDQFGINVLG
jgi:hypothetical protein